MLKQRLDDIMKPFIAKASQLVNLGSSQQCEHANREVSLKAPKNIYYGGSEALDVRVQATAAFINEGRNYIVEVNKQADLSPGHYTQKYAQHCAIKRQKCQETFAKPSTKGRRLFLKKERAVNQSATESLEGATYQSEVGHTADIDIDKVPDPIPRGVFKPVCSSGEPSYITVDLETTDLIRGDVYPHITQIAAKHVGTENSFNCYVLPKLPMSASAERVTKIIVTNSIDMCVDGVPVETKTIQTALRDFLIWLNQFRYVFLIAHNGKRFDFPIVVNACQASGMFNKFSSCVLGLVDSLHVFKSISPKRESYKQEDLARSLLSKVYNAHNALCDVDCLSELVIYALKQDDKCITVKSFSPSDVKYNMDSNKEKHKNLPSLSILIASGVMKSSTADNVASSGLNFKHLQTIFQRKGEDGLYNVFTMKNSEGLPRVTNSKRVLESVIPKLVSYFDGK
ncbi:uncharacterized protein LOC132722076 [Ruditapes philippinarum]|uniref:uncharacterized protein LOC132722076 n=1 Tax=Ruditapes philippinarum TaxID=129788 RepID=UPI00295BDF5B|nr:uncharacterized protein LOC132722076 [Ruditapes philippinarum]